MSQLHSRSGYIIAIVLISLLTACGGGGSNDTPPEPYVPTLYQAIYTGSAYQYTTLFYIKNAPDDTDWSRWGIMHTGDAYRLFFMREGRDDILYQFSYNPGTGDYEYAYNSVNIVGITNIPPDADTSSIAMSHNGSGDSVLTSYYAHMKSLTIPARIHTFRYNTTTYEYERSYDITGAPTDTDWSRWAMMIGDGASRFYAGKQGDDSTIYQFKYNNPPKEYGWGVGALPSLTVTGMPAEADTSDFAMLHNGTEYQFFYLNQP